MKRGKEIIAVSINGELHELAVEPQQTLLEVLRDSLGLTGAKEGCGTGECGSCTVLLDGEPVLSCLTLAVECQSREITTIEGLGGIEGMTLVQEAFLEKGGVQCGFCTPGMVLATTALLNRNATPSDEEVRVALEGHLCRCTGYNKIIEAIETAAEKISGVQE
ncbi:MAG: (2Fe-2S)-binding protein [Deltaproteobacteria bacterium]|nr:(2Fe-2S)-binding protein [Deltaproteobacteria bacterium]